MKKCKQFKVECLDQSTFELLRTKVLKQRLKQLKKKPKKNKYGINRIKNELKARKIRKQLDEIERLALADDIDSMLEELDKEFGDKLGDDGMVYDDFNTPSDSTFGKMEITSFWFDSPEEQKEQSEQKEQHVLSDKARDRIHEMKEKLADRVLTDPDFTERLQVDSDKVKVVAELRFKSSNEIYGYLIQNVSTCIVDLNYNNSYFEVLCPGDVVAVTLENFVRFTCKPEFSFTLANGTVKNTKHLEEVLKEEEETGQLIVYGNYHFVPASEEQSVPIIFIDNIEWIVEDDFEMDFDLEEKQRGQ